MAPSVPPPQIPRTINTDVGVVRGLNPSEKTPGMKSSMLVVNAATLPYFALNAYLRYYDDVIRMCERQHI